jgi:hypothetical protein
LRLSIGIDTREPSVVEGSLDGDGDDEAARVFGISREEVDIGGGGQDRRGSNA